ncbi:MAG: indole-3-glycerol-phosphate synthase [SAR324 cluster bacterium]|nr:indole-3-glycerol-phosphate synthase [SAR324 cluster bacterium]
MKTFLEKVRGEKLLDISRDKAIISEDELWVQVESVKPTPSFADSIRRNPEQAISIIAEVKAKAPSRQNVKSLDAASVVLEYENAGVKAVSVLTDEKYFGGSLKTLELVRETIELPLLHKEFIVDPYQLLQGRVRGASAALILVYYYQEAELKTIIEKTEEIGLEAVVECSLPEELPRALRVNPNILMINNRPIAAIPSDPSKTYDQGDVEVSARWWHGSDELREWKTQPGKVLISASCISTPEHVRHIVNLPYDAFLIGNAAMMADDRISFLKNLMCAN